MKTTINSILSNAKTYELPIARSYVRHWGMVEAVRELIQNSIDSDSPFEYQFNDDTLSIRSRFASLPVSTLLLGATSKADNKEKIGSFGEGYKIALLVLTRLEYDVRVLNGDRVWKPVFKHSRQFDAEVLCIEDSTSQYKTEGIAFEVSGLSPADIAQIRESCLQMQDSIGEIVTTGYGDILLDRPGRLYVGGLFVCETKLQYGYNVKPEYLRLERDRQTVSSFDLQWLTKNMWFESERYNQIAELIDQEAPDLEYAEHGTPELVKEACYRAFRQKYPGAVVAKDQAELDSLVKRGMTNVVVHSTFSPIVSSYSGYKSEVVVPSMLPADVMQQWLAKHRKAMRTESIVAFKELIAASRDWRLK